MNDKLARTFSNQSRRDFLKTGAAAVGTAFAAHIVPASVLGANAPSNRINVGVIGRPANDGETHVWYCRLEDRAGELAVELLPLPYDHQGLAAEMRREGLPEEFVETILTGWWTTCLEILPAKERAVSRF